MPSLVKATPLEDIEEVSSAKHSFCTVGRCRPPFFNSPLDDPHQLYEECTASAQSSTLTVLPTRIRSARILFRKLPRVMPSMRAAWD